MYVGMRKSLCSEIGYLPTFCDVHNNNNNNNNHSIQGSLTYIIHPPHIHTYIHITHTCIILLNLYNNNDDDDDGDDDFQITLCDMDDNGRYKKTHTKKK